MALETQSKTMEALKEAITSNACCSGTYKLSHEECILFYGRDKIATRLDLTSVTEADLDHLAKTCDPATFGKDSVDVLDESYRKAGKLNVEHFSSNFSLPNSGLLDIVRSDLLDGTQERKAIKAELYKLNVYGPGAFFKAHKDTPRGANMFGSLVVVLPSPHTGGTLKIRHHGKEVLVDSETPSTNSEGPVATYAAFYSDVEHEVSPVTSGNRITLTYNLYFAKNATEILRSRLGNPTNHNASLLEQALSAALANSDFLPYGGRLGFGLSHQYALSTTDMNSLDIVLDKLKGSDETLRFVSEKLGLKAHIRAVYKIDEGEIMTEKIKKIPEEQWGDDQIVSEWMINELDGVFISYDDFNYNEPPVHPVDWVTPRTTFNQISYSFVAYGNEAYLDMAYCDLCLVLFLGKPGNRAGRMEGDAD